MDVAIAATGGAFGGALSGFIAAVVSLQAKRVRNSYLVTRGRSGYRDCVFPRVFVPLGTIAGLVVATILSGWLVPVTAAAIGALAPGSLLSLVVIAASMSQALRS